MFSMYFILGNLPDHGRRLSLPRRLMNSNRCTEEPGQTVQEAAPLKADMGKHNRWMGWNKESLNHMFNPKEGQEDRHGWVWVSSDLVVTLVIPQF